MLYYAFKARFSSEISTVDEARNFPVGVKYRLTFITRQVLSEIRFSLPERVIVT